MDEMTNMKTFTPKPLAELQSRLKVLGILSADIKRTYTAKKEPTIRTSEKAFKPLTLEEMRSHLVALSGDTGKCQPKKSVKKKGWNSSVKVDRTVSHRANGQSKLHTVKKALNFPPNPKTNGRPTISTETPKIPKLEVKAKKAFNVHDKNNDHISGVNKIPESPAFKRKPVFKSKMTVSNKENVLCQSNAKKLPVTPKQKMQLQKSFTVPNTPITLSNMSWKSSGDTSFLLVEKDIEEKTRASKENRVKENVDKTAHQVSTPFKEYRNVQEFFSNTMNTENSLLYNDNTIMCFDKQNISNENIKVEDSVIISLCNMLDKATVNKYEKGSIKYENLLAQVEKQTMNNIELIENKIKSLKEAKEYQLRSLQILKKLISEYHSVPVKRENEKVLEQKTELKQVSMQLENNISPSTSRACTVIKACSKSPTYKIPKKNSCLNKNVFRKSMTNVANGMQTPKDPNNKGLNMYMEMKRKMNFLHTPVINFNRTETQSTPAITSQNLQMQLDKLYNCS